MTPTTQKKTAPAKGAAKKSTNVSLPKSAGAAADDSMLKDFFIDELKDIYWAEKHLVKTLPKMA